MSHQNVSADVSTNLVGIDAHEKATTFPEEKSLASEDVAMEESMHLEGNAGMEGSEGSDSDTSADPLPDYYGEGD